MASLISQMRNGQQPQQFPMQSQLNESIEQVRGMMQQVKGAQDPQAMLAAMLQNNPNTATIANMLQGNGNLEQIARNMARQKGIDINSLLKQLSS